VAFSFPKMQSPVTKPNSSLSFRFLAEGLGMFQTPTERRSSTGPRDQTSSQVPLFPRYFPSSDLVSSREWSRTDLPPPSEQHCSKLLPRALRLDHCLLVVFRFPSGSSLTRTRWCSAVRRTARIYQVTLFLVEHRRFSSFTLFPFCRRRRFVRRREALRPARGSVWTNALFFFLPSLHLVCADRIAAQTTRQALIFVDPKSDVF